MIRKYYLSLVLVFSSFVVPSRVLAQPAYRVASREACRLIGAGEPSDQDSSIRTMQGHSGSVLGVAFSPDGKILASCSRDKTTKLWDIEMGKLLRTFSEH